MTTKVINLKMTRGDSSRIGMSITGLDTAPEEVIFSVKKAYSSEEYIVQKTLDDGIEDESENGSMVYAIKIEPEDTEDLQYGAYVYDVEFTMHGDRKTLVVGKFEVLPDVTRH